MEKLVDIDDAISKAIIHIAKFVVPLYIEERSKPVLLGSGFFVESGGKPILVSAAHVLNQISETRPLFMYRRPDEVVQITGKRHLSDPNGIDLGFVVADNISLPWKDVDRFACRAEYLYSRRTPRENRHYVIAGYPETKNRVNVRKRAIETSIHAYHARSISDSEYAKAGLDPEQSIALPFNRKKVFDGSGVKKQFPIPDGISGSPIWELFSDPIGSDEPDTFPLVGVVTSYKKGILFGTDIGNLLSRLSSAA